MPRITSSLVPWTRPGRPICGCLDKFLTAISTGEATDSAAIGLSVEKYSHLRKSKKRLAFFQTSVCKINVDSLETGIPSANDYIIVVGAWL